MASSANKSATLPAQQATRVQQYVDAQLEKTRQQVKFNEILGTVLTWIACVAAFFLVLALVDAWLLPLTTAFRWLALTTFVVGSLAWFFLNLAPLLFRKINPDYAARMIEQAKPGFKNSVLNYVFLRRQPEKINAAVLDAVSRQAAKNLNSIPDDTNIDRSRLIRIGFVLVGLMLFAVAYKILSPKDPLQTVNRILFPGQQIARPAAVQINDVQPGDCQLFFGDKLRVTAKLKGPHQPQDVRLFFSTADGQLVDQSIPMVPDEAGAGYHCDLVTGNGGIQQSLSYRIEARDGVTPDYRVEVKPNPSIAIESIQLTPPAYTGLPVRTLVGQGDIEAIEGTEAMLYAVANLPVEVAYIELLTEVPDAEGGRPGATRYQPAAPAIQMRLLENNRASGRFTVALNARRDRPLATHYQLRFVSTSDDRNKKPNIYPIRVTPDLAPEIRVIRPREREVSVPVNGTLPIDIEANDLDFSIRSVTLHLDHQGTKLFGKALPLQSQNGNQRVTARFPFVPAQFRLQPGDQVVFHAAARDNRVSARSLQPDPNISQSDNYVIRITDIDPQAEQERKPDESGEPDEPGDENPNSSDPNDSDQPSEQSDEGENPSDNDSGQNDSPETGSDSDAPSEQPGESESQDGGEPGSENPSENMDESGGQDQEQQGSTSDGGSSQEEGDGQQSPQDSQDSSDEQSGGGSGNETGGSEGDSNNQNSDSDSGSGGTSGQPDKDAPGGAGPAGDAPQESGKQDPGDAGDSSSGSGTPQEAGDPSAQAGNGQRDRSLKQGKREKLSDNASEGEEFEKLQELLEEQQSKSEGPSDPADQNRTHQENPNDQGNNPHPGSGDPSDQPGDQPPNGEKPQGSNQPPSSQQQNNKGQSPSEPSGQQSPTEAGQESSDNNAQPGEPNPQSGSESADQGEPQAAGSDQGQPTESPGGDSTGEQPQQQPGEPGTQAGDASSAGNPSEGAAPSDSDPGVGTANPSNQPSGEPQNSPQENGPAGTNSADSAPENEMQPQEQANLNHAKKATDLILDKLEEQKYQPDQELLDKMNWTQDDLNQFLDRWKRMKANAQTGDAQAQREYEDAVKSLGLRPNRDLRTERQRADDAGGINQDAQVIQPPADLAPDFNDFLRDRNRVRD